MRPTPEQATALNGLRTHVLGVMEGMPAWEAVDLDSLRAVPLGILRAGTLRRHGVTRWHAGTPPSELNTASVKVIDLHPELLRPAWLPYGAHVLHHEYIHATGHRPHDAAFRRWEASWPGMLEPDAARSFALHLQEQRVRWWWTCEACNMRHGRARRGNGRYACRRCGRVLADVAAEVEAP